MVNIAHKVTKKLKHKVMLLTATGVTQEGIAGVLKIDMVTLRKYYAHELMVGRETIRDQIKEMLWKAADNGNVSAMKHLDEKVASNGAPKQYIGKKAEQYEAARTAGGGVWGDLLKVDEPIAANGSDKPN